MPTRDALELRKYTSTAPNDLDDAPRFSQLIESTQDAFVYELRRFFDVRGFRTDTRAAVPTVEKYAVGFGPDLDPYETYVRILADFPDVTERLPHIAVTAVSGANRPLTMGRPLIGQTQAPPRVVTALPGPYALDNPVAQSTRVTVATLPGGPGEAYTVTIDGESVTAAFSPGASGAAIAAGLAAALRGSAVGLLYTVAAAAGAVVSIAHRTPGVAFSVVVSSNLAAGAGTAAGNASAPAQLVIQTRPGRGAPVVSTILFPPSRFASSESMGALSAAAVARVFNEQALYATARVVGVGVGEGLQLEVGGRLGAETPNEIEVLPGSTPSLVAALGLATMATGVPGDGDAIALTPGGVTVTLDAEPFGDVVVGEYLTVAGATSAANNGRFPVTAAADGVLGYDNPFAVAEPFGGTVFVGRRDDSRNSARPVMNRYHMGMQLNVSIDILAESTNERREVLDLVLAMLLFEVEMKFSTFFGRGVFDEAYPDEHYQIILHQEISQAGEQEFARGEDQKNKIQAVRLSVPVTTFWYSDQTVLVPSGPSAGLSWTLEGTNVSPSDVLPGSS